MFAHAVAPHQPERLGVGVGLRTDSDHVSDDRVGQREQTARNPAHAAMTDRRKVEPPELGTLAQHVLDLGRDAAEPNVDHYEHHTDVAAIEFRTAQIGSDPPTVARSKPAAPPLAQPPSRTETRRDG